MHPLLTEAEAILRFKLVLTNSVNDNRPIPMYYSADTDYWPIIGAFLNKTLNILCIVGKRRSCAVQETNTISCSRIKTSNVALTHP